MVARGTYRELQLSGVDFTSLLKYEQEDERQDAAPFTCLPRVLSDRSSMSSLSSSQYSLIEGTDALSLVCIFNMLNK